MADTPAADAPAPAFVAVSSYLVSLVRPVEWPKGSGIMHSPRRNPHLMKGAVLNDVVAEAPNALGSVVPR